MTELRPKTGGERNLEAAEAELSRLREERDALEHARMVAASSRDGFKSLLEEERARCARLQQALAKADKAASKSHDAMWAMDFDKTSASSLERDEWKRLRERASKAVWEIHNLLRPLIDAGEALAGPDTPADRTAAPESRAVTGRPADHRSAA